MQFADPQGNVLQMGLREGMKVADLGAGSGHYALAAANVVGGGGMVYAVDVQDDVLTSLKNIAKERGIKNLETIWGDVETGTTIGDHSLDAVILSNTLFQLDKKEAAIAEIKRILRPGGRVLVIDWAGSYGGLGPIGEQVVPEHEAETMFITRGFHKVKSFRGGPHHYSLLFTL